MKIAVLSGKGGTGKTTVAVNLATVLACRYVDCDVEAPNGFLFLQPTVESKQDVLLQVPEIDHALCTRCQECVNHCQFNALLGAGSRINLFEKLCHSCGLCTLVCRFEAIKEKPRVIGYVEYGKRVQQECWRGVLTPGEPMGVPIIDALKDKLADGWSMLDAPPGSSCSVVATAIDTDFAILVTEPTPFGVHDLDMATQVIKKLGVPGAIVINRSVGDDRLIEDYAATNGIPVIGRLPFSLGAAQAIARGELLVQLPKWRARFEELGNRVRELVGWTS